MEKLLHQDSFFSMVFGDALKTYQPPGVKTQKTKQDQDEKTNNLERLLGFKPAPSTASESLE